MSTDELSVFRTRDYGLIRQLATHPKIFPHIADDYSDVTTWKPVENENVIYLLAARTNVHEPFGFAVFVPQTWSCWQAHFGFLPQAYGGPALQAWKEMFGWMWSTTKAVRIVGEIVRENRRAIKFCLRAGCAVYGLNPKSYLRGGVLRDQVCVGISKPESRVPSSEKNL